MVRVEQKGRRVIITYSSSKKAKAGAAELFRMVELSDIYSLSYNRLIHALNVRAKLIAHGEIESWELENNFRTQTSPAGTR